MTATETTTWAGSAFGLALRSEFPLPGLEPDGDGAAGERAIALALSPGSADPFEGAERLQEWHYPDGTLGLTIDRNERGYRFYLYGAGVFVLAGDGSRALLHLDPDRAGAWDWRRYLIGQVLPFAALLQGLEVFHASGVEIEGGAVLLAGGSGLGKSTLALNMHLGGSGFLADDSVAIELTGDDRLLAHPAIATAKVREGARDLLREDTRGVLHDVVVSDEHETRYGVQTATGPLPLRAVCVLELGEEPGTLMASEGKADPWELLGSTFNEVVRDPARLQGQLDLCGRIAADVPFLRAQVGPRPGPKAADKLAAYLQKLK